MLEGTLSPDQDVARQRTDIALPGHVLLLVAAMAAAIVAQGGYHLTGRALATVLVCIAFCLAARNRQWSGMWPILSAAGAMVVWAVVRAVGAGAVTMAVPTVLSIVCLIAALLVAQRTDAAQRELFAVVITIVGALMAMSGWIAVVFRIPSWTTVANGLWRAATTITYPNAAGALLASVSVLAISLQLTRPRAVPYAAVTYLLLVGLAATLSRAALLALLVGLVVLGLLAGVRATVAHLAAPGLGAAVAVAGLVPLFPATAPARPVLAVLALLAGLAVTAGLTRLRGRVRVVAALTGLALALGTGAAMIGWGLAPRTLIGGRVSLSSPDRVHATDAALDVVAARPVFGVGPGRGWFTWTGEDGRQLAMRYVHNEYLQVLVELGAIGLALVLCLLVAVAILVRRGRPGHGPVALWAGSAAGLVALLVHSGFDFLWHIPAVLLTAGALIGLAAPPVQTVLPSTEKER
ncbi:O-antigen ligase family protein [Actinophytocola sp.]|uniref:O-antigen ligase family protein n=1 Tax=Actinophytocola sp. TaxID=1872138 RepID=UPI002D7E94E6|nr:O-antigen ligase family protein [Actinophytocola sp.]HET9141150.1 O-antigen ligase family protein [Actinophytocola sp.]